MLCWGSNSYGQVMLRAVADFHLRISVFAVLNEESLVADDVGLCSSEMAQQPAVLLPFLLLAF